MIVHELKISSLFTITIAEGTACRWLEWLKRNGEYTVVAPKRLWEFITLAGVTVTVIPNFLTRIVQHFVPDSYTVRKTTVLFRLLCQLLLASTCHPLHSFLCVSSASLQIVIPQRKWAITLPVYARQSMVQTEILGKLYLWKVITWKLNESFCEYL